jgi:hypothetical protein
MLLIPCIRSRELYFSFVEESGLAVVVGSQVIVLNEAGCGRCNDSEYWGNVATPASDKIEVSGSSAIGRYLDLYSTYVVSASCIFVYLVFFTFLHLRQRSQHIAPIPKTKKVTPTVRPITTEGLLAAYEARLFREGAACNIAERTAKAMGAISTV